MLLLLSILTIPASTWVYQDGRAGDAKFEEFGPRADKLLIKLYSTAENEWEALKNGEIDTTDWPLTKTYYDLFTSPPLNEKINVVGYGTAYGFAMLDTNNSNSTSSPVYPNPCTVLSFREAIAHLVDRTWLDTIIGAGFYVPIWVPMSPALGKYCLDIPNPYPYDPATAEALLDLDGFPVNPATGWRFWDRNHNGIEEPGEYLELKFVIRIDDPSRLAVGNKIKEQLINVKIRVNGIYATAAQARTIVMIQRNFHLYTGSDTCYDPTNLYSFHSSMNNYNGIDDAELDYWLERLINATTQAEAVLASHSAQQVFVDKSFKVPIWSSAEYKAMYRRYTGGTAGNPVNPDDGENAYRNVTWQGVVNLAGQGVDNFFSFLNMHPTDCAYGHNGNMSIRWGFKTDDLRSLNPLYADWIWDWDVLGLIYDNLIRQNPYSHFTEPDWIPWIAKNFTVGTYNHPVYGNCTKVKITLRTDVTWQDGTPLTTADVYFTMVELDDILEKLGYPPPMWVDNVQNISDFKIFDPYNFEILFDFKSAEELYYGSVLPYISGTPILPKHVWKHIVENEDPTSFAPDPNLVGSGPWRLKEYVSTNYVLMVRNTPCSKVQTNLPGSVPKHSPYGYFRLYPLYIDGHFEPPYEYGHRIPPYVPVIFKATLENLIQEEIIAENSSAVNMSNPVYSLWNKTWPTKTRYELQNWIDEDSNELLSQGDIVSMMPVKDAPTLLQWYHVEYLLYEPPGPYAMVLKPVVKVNKYVYLDETQIAGPSEIYVKSRTPHEEYFGYFGFAPGKHTFKIATHIKEPNWDSWKFNCTWINYTFTFWATIKEDIVGSTLYDDIGFPTYPYKTQLPSPDIKVDLRDVFAVALAYGSYPGHPRWNPICDISCDYKIDLKDYFAVCKKYGWSG
jgi:ABC-type transport system substrate-binding protein